MFPLTAVIMFWKVRERERERERERKRERERERERKRERERELPRRDGALPLKCSHHNTEI